jgi:hypothetical protein
MAVFALEANGAANESVARNREQTKTIRRFMISILPEFDESRVESSAVVFNPHAGSQFRLPESCFARESPQGLNRLLKNAPKQRARRHVM